MKGKPTVAGFLSYVHADDEFENGRISRLRERLEQAIRFYSGLREFRIFQDWRDIGWGQQWEKAIAESIENSIVLFPIVTPSFFTSEGCRKEIFAFEERQAKLGTDDLILPIYYLVSEQMIDSDQSSSGSEEARAAELIKRAQFEDWRALRQTEQTDPAYAQAIERLGRRAIPALKRGTTATTTTSAAPQRRLAAASPPREAGASAAATSNQESAGEAAGAGSTPGYIATVTVDQMPGRGEFTTISEAVARASAGARIHIRPGHYREHLVINKPLELVGDGPREDIVIVAHGETTISFDTNIGVIRGLTLRQSGAGKFFLIRVVQGRLTLEDCDLSSSNLACLSASNGADPRVRRNLIHNSKQGGVFISDQGRGTYEDNDIFANGYSGLEVKDDADPTVRRNRIYENKQSGIYNHDNGRGIYEDNDIFGNGSYGFAVKKESDPIVRRNRIHENNHNGITSYENGRGAYEDNEIFGNRAAGIYVGSGGAPIVRRNRIQKNVYEAVWVDEGGAGVFEENDLRDNTCGPWDIHASANAEVKRARNIDK